MKIIGVTNEGFHLNLHSIQYICIHTLFFKTLLLYDLCQQYTPHSYYSLYPLFLGPSIRAFFPAILKLHFIYKTELCLKMKIIVSPVFFQYKWRFPIAFYMNGAYSKHFLCFITRNIAIQSFWRRYLVPSSKFNEYFKIKNTTKCLLLI